MTGAILYSKHGRDIHDLECLFYMNKIYFNHVIQQKKKRPSAMAKGTL